MHIMFCKPGVWPGGVYQAVEQQCQERLRPAAVPAAAVANFDTLLFICMRGACWKQLPRLELSHATALDCSCLRPICLPLNFGPVPALFPHCAAPASSALNSA